MKLLFLLFFFSAQICFAKTILISDVDDTIKDARVRNTSESFKRLVRTGPEMVIIEMNKLLSEVQYDYAVEALFYVSKIPAFVDSLHAEFLFRNSFPVGEIRSWDFSSDFKFTTISDIIKQEKPDLVILIGDNGESDPDIYNRISEKYSGRGIQFKTYIRKAYKYDYFVYPQQILFSNGLDLRKIMLKSRDSDFGFY